MYRWVEHTGELELEIEASSEREIFEQGFEAMRELLAGKSGEQVAPALIGIEAADRAALFADWLAELAFLAETEGLVPERLRSLEVSHRRLEAVIEGSRGRPPHLVKAVTYHRLAVERLDDRWRASVVLDV